MRLDEIEKLDVHRIPNGMFRAIGRDPQDSDRGTLYYGMGKTAEDATEELRAELERRRLWNSKANNQ